MVIAWDLFHCVISSLGPKHMQLCTPLKVILFSYLFGLAFFRCWQSVNHQDCILHRKVFVRWLIVNQVLPPKLHKRVQTNFTNVSSMEWQAINFHLIISNHVMFNLVWNLVLYCSCILVISFISNLGYLVRFTNIRCCIYIQHLI